MGKQFWVMVGLGGLLNALLWGLLVWGIIEWVVSWIEKLAGVS